MHNHFCHSIKRFFAHCVKPFLLPWTAVTTSSCDAVQTEIPLNMPKSNMPKCRSTRKDETCGRTASLHANDQFHWLTRCSCGCVVCMLEMLSAKTSLTTSGIVQQAMILRPHLYLDWLARDVVRKNFTDALWNCATRDDPKKKHAGRTASLHANDQFH